MKKNTPKNTPKSSLLLHDLLQGTHPLSERMKLYVATPWCECEGTWKSCASCNLPPGIQSHGGDLFQHSQWTALYLRQWLEGSCQPPSRYRALHAILRSVIQSPLLATAVGAQKVDFLLMCGFFHDIGKGGDGIYDMYSARKYNAAGESQHPRFCERAIRRPGGRHYDGILRDCLKALLSACANARVARALLALCAATHWEFGKLNMDGAAGIDAGQYVAFVRTHLRAIVTSVRLSKSERDLLHTNFVEVLKLCMAVSCADIAAAYNDELQSSHGVTVAPSTHRSVGGAWTQYEMKKNHSKYIRAVLRKCGSRSLFVPAPPTKRHSIDGGRRSCRNKSVSS
jgi:hypothetical protein